SVEQLKAIWASDSTVKTWKDVDPSWPDRKIVLYSPDKDSGTFEFFTEAIVGKAKSQRDDVQSSSDSMKTQRSNFMASSKSQRDDVQSSSDDNILVSGVAGDVDGLGYFGYAYYAANQDKLRAVPI